MVSRTAISLKTNSIFFIPGAIVPKIFKQWFWLEASSRFVHERKQGVFNHNGNGKIFLQLLCREGSKIFWGHITNQQAWTIHIQIYISCWQKDLYREAMGAEIVCRQALWGNRGLKTSLFTSLSKSPGRTIPENLINKIH